MTLTGRPSYCTAHIDRIDIETVVCDKCGLQWDVNDPDPPACKSWQQIKHDRTEQQEQSHRVNKQNGNKQLDKLREFLDE